MNHINLAPSSKRRTAMPLTIYVASQNAGKVESDHCPVKDLQIWSLHPEPSKIIPAGLEPTSLHTETVGLTEQLRVRIFQTLTVKSYLKSNLLSTIYIITRE